MKNVSAPDPFLSSSTKEMKMKSRSQVGELAIALTESRLSLVTHGEDSKTPLYEEHVRLGARMVPFPGGRIRVQYPTISQEKQGVLNTVGMFDISHMGQLIVDGADAREWLNTMLTNNVGKLDVGMGQYTFLLNESGGIIDDLIVYRIDDLKFLLVVNAARTDEDFAWLEKWHQRPADYRQDADATVRLANRSADFGGVAIQGPRIAELFHALFGPN